MLVIYSSYILQSTGLTITELLQQERTGGKQWIIICMTMISINMMIKMGQKSNDKHMHENKK
jgi:hypothetical protein